MNCLRSTSGCTISSVANLEGWFYFVFETTPTPSTLVVTLEATVRDYSLLYNEKCKLYGRLTRCFLTVPTIRVKTGTISDRDGERDNYETKYLPFSIIYDTFPNSNITSPISNAPPPSQSLNISVDLSSACSRTNLYSYIIVISLFSALLLTSTGLTVCLYINNLYKCIRRRNKANDQPEVWDDNDPKNLQLQTVIPNAQCGIENKSLPTYDCVIMTEKGLDGQLPYYQH